MQPAVNAYNLKASIIALIAYLVYNYWQSEIQNNCFPGNEFRKPLKDMF